MSEENTQNTNVDETQQEANTTTTTPDLEALVAARVDASLKDIKDKLNKAYGARDEAVKKAETLEAERRAAEIARLAEEGKHKEAYEMQLADERVKREAAERRAVELTRDVEVRNALAQYPTRSSKALDMAYSEVVRELVQNENGVWVHKSGVSIQTFVKSFSENDDNAFLFKQKTSSGSGSTSTTTAVPPPERKSVFAMSQEEVIKMASEGKLRR